MRRPLGAHLSARRGIGAVAIPTIRDRGGGFRIEGSADRPIGATFGSSAAFEIGVVRPDASDSTDDSTATAIEGHLAEAEGVHVEVFGSIDELNGVVRRQSLSLGVVFADALDADLATGRAGIVVVADPTSGDAKHRSTSFDPRSRPSSHRSTRRVSRHRSPGHRSTRQPRPRRRSNRPLLGCGWRSKTSATPATTT